MSVSCGYGEEWVHSGSWANLLCVRSNAAMSRSRSQSTIIRHRQMAFRSLTAASGGCDGVMPFSSHSPGQLYFVWEEETNCILLCGEWKISKCSLYHLDSLLWTGFSICASLRAAPQNSRVLYHRQQWQSHVPDRSWRTWSDDQSCIKKGQSNSEKKLFLGRGMWLSIYNISQSTYTIT